LALALASLVGGGVVLYGRSLDERERAFLVLAQVALDEGRDPGPALAAARELPDSLRARVSVLSLTEQLEARAQELEARAQADALLAQAPQDADLGARGARLAEAARLDPQSPRLQALLAHHELEVWARRPQAPRAAEWEALQSRLAALPATPAVLTARAGVTLRRRGRDPGARSEALGSLARAGQVSEPTSDAAEARWAAYARAWRGVLAQEPLAALPALEALAADPAAGPLLGSMAATLRGRVRWTRGDLRGATADLERAQRDDPVAAGPALWLAWAGSEGAVPAASAELGGLVERWPRSAVARAAHAQALGRSDPSRGLELAQQALSLDRGSDLAHLVAARFLASLGRLDEAFGHAVKAVLWGRSLAAHLLRIELGLARRDHEFAQHDLRAARALAPEDERVSLWAARLALREERPREALRLAEGLLEGAPSQVAGHVLAARALGDLRRWEEAARHAGQAVKLDPQDPAARLARARVLVETRQSVLALADLDQLPQAALRIDAGAEAAYLRGRAHEELGETPRARAAYERFLELAHSRDVRRRLAARYLEKTRPK